MNINVKVSVIIPVYNTEKYLRECLDSICGQTLKEIQIICVDDGSTDGSLSILEEYSVKDSRVQVLKHKHTGKGAASARNYGLEHATGEYLLVLDSDDYFREDLAEKTYEKAKQTDADIVIYNSKFIDENGKEIDTAGIINYKSLPNKEVFCIEDCPQTLFQITAGMAWSRLWKHEFIKNNNHKFQSVTWLDDAFFSNTAMTTAERITILDEKFVIYRRNRMGSQSDTKDENGIKSSVDFFTEFKKYLKEKNIYEKLEESYFKLQFNHYMQRLRDSKTFKSFCNTYLDMRKCGLIDIVNLKEANKTSVVQNMIEIVDKIMEQEPEEFLLSKFTNIGNKKISFPASLFNSTDKVVLYGAGIIGKNFLTMNMENSYCNIVAWADRDYIKKGFPICSPDSIPNINYDKILIAIEDERIAKLISNDLCNLGIIKDDIIWVYPYEEV